MGYGKQDQVRVARIGKPHGIKGEVTVELFTDFPERRFAPGVQLEVNREDKGLPKFEQLTVKGSRWHKNILLVSFDEFADRNTAEAHRDYYLLAPPMEATDQEDAWYADELIGFSVYQGSFESTEAGKVTDLITGVQDLLEVQLADGREVLLPFVEEIVPEIDGERGALVIKPPPGLLELNQD